MQPLAAHETIAQHEPDPCVFSLFCVSQQSLGAGRLRGSDILACSHARSLAQTGFEHRTLLSREPRGIFPALGPPPCRHSRGADGDWWAQTQDVRGVVLL